MSRGPLFTSLTDDELLQMEKDRRDRAHRTPVSDTKERAQALQSSMRSGHVSGEWLRVYEALKSRGLSPL